MPLQGFGIAPTGTHLLQIGRHGLLKSSQGKMTGLVLPGGAARRAGGWYVHGLSLRGVLVSSRDRFFKEVRLRWEGLRGASLGEFWWPGFFPVGSQVWMVCAEAMHERLNECGDCALRSLVSDLLQ